MMVKLLWVISLVLVGTVTVLGVQLETSDEQQLLVENEEGLEADLELDEMGRLLKRRRRRKGGSGGGTVTGTTVMPVVAQRSGPVCQAMVDVVFILDSSNSIGPGEWAREIRFVKDVASYLRVTLIHSRLGFVSFSGDIQDTSDFNQPRSYNINDFTKFLSNLQRARRSTNLGLALQEAGDMFKANKMRRQNANFVTILVSDGNPTSKKNTNCPSGDSNVECAVRQAKALKKLGSDLFYIPVGKDSDGKLFQSVIPQSNVMKVSSFAGLAGIAKKLATQVCPSKLQSPTPYPTPKPTPKPTMKVPPPIIKVQKPNLPCSNIVKLCLCVKNKNCIDVDWCDNWDYPLIHAQGKVFFHECPKKVHVTPPAPKIPPIIEFPPNTSKCSYPVDLCVCIDRICYDLPWCDDWGFNEVRKLGAVYDVKCPTKKNVR